MLNFYSKLQHSYCDNQEYAKHEALLTTHLKFDHFTGGGLKSSNFRFSEMSLKLYLKVKELYVKRTKQQKYCGTCQERSCGKPHTPPAGGVSMQHKDWTYRELYCLQ